MSSNGITIILPVLNEAENLNFLIPELAEVAKNHYKENYEIAVVDDNSIDNTQDVVEKHLNRGINILYKKRENEKSLPESIFDGIKISNFSSVMWLDADGSMDSTSVNKLISNFIKNENKVYIGSRFHKEGGYKGSEYILDANKAERVLKLINSEDSLIAIYLSIIFNKILNLILNVGVKDLTSGFIVGKKTHFEEPMFSNHVYGEYFISVVTKLYINQIEIEEVGYYCLIRKYGKSKSSSSLIKMILLSKPYFSKALLARKWINESKR